MGLLRKSEFYLSTIREQIRVRLHTRNLSNKVGILPDHFKVSISKDMTELLNKLKNDYDLSGKEIIILSGKEEIGKLDSNGKIDYACNVKRLQEIFQYRQDFVVKIQEAA